ncbi:MAG: HDOD domain-containing protein [Calditrichia bacterium]
MTLPHEVKNKITGIENIATLPTVAADILESIRSSATSMKSIAQLIERDASITAKIIKVSNSPLWGYAGRIDNVHRALVILGLKQVTNIIIAVSLYSTFTRLKPNPYFNRKKFWLHSAGTGQISRTLSKKLHLNFHGEDLLAALIHDIGKLMLDQFFGDQFKYILEFSKTSGRQVLEVEKEILGCTHADLAAWLLRRWNFPESICTAVLYHHHPDLAPHHKTLTSVIHLSDMLCEMWGIGFDEDTYKFSIQDDPAWEILKLNHPHLFNLDMEKFTFELKSDIEKAQLFIQLIKD